MAWEFPQDRRFELQVDGFAVFIGCQWIEQDEEHVTVDYMETGALARAQLRLCDIRAIFRPVPLLEPDARSASPTTTAVAP